MSRTVTRGYCGCLHLRDRCTGERHEKSGTRAEQARYLALLPPGTHVFVAERSPCDACRTCGRVPAAPVHA